MIINGHIPYENSDCLRASLSDTRHLNITILYSFTFQNACTVVTTIGVFCTVIIEIPPSLTTNQEKHMMQSLGTLQTGALSLSPRVVLDNDRHRVWREYGATQTFFLKFCCCQGQRDAT